jgi:hypothetical protein
MIQKKEEKKDKETQLHVAAKPWRLWVVTVFCLAVCVVKVFFQQ